MAHCVNIAGDIIRGHHPGLILPGARGHQTRVQPLEVFHHIQSVTANPVGFSGINAKLTSSGAWSIGEMAFMVLTI